MGLAYTEFLLHGNVIGLALQGITPIAKLFIDKVDAFSQGLKAKQPLLNQSAT